MKRLSFSCMLLICGLVTGAATAAGTTTTLKLVTGNLSVDAIQHSPIGTLPATGFKAGLPTSAQLIRWKNAGLAGYEDYIAWGMVEPVEGRFDFSSHDKVYDLLSSCGLVYVPYIWCHVPPVWLRKDPRATLMKCNEHGESCNMLSIFDPETIDWYRHFYEAFHASMGSRIQETYACLLGPYAEGNYPLPYSNWVVNLDHCHEGYWCADRHALPAFQKALRLKYKNVAALNKAWHSKHRKFDDIRFPEEIRTGSIPSAESRNQTDRRRWLDFIHWYHDALRDFSRKVIEMVCTIFPHEKISIKPGGNAGWMNPISWGTYCPGFAKLASQKKVHVQSADSRGAYWADKWCSTAYAYYGVEYRTEAAGELSRDDFIKRTFTDVSCGATRLFTYDIEKHLEDSTRSLHLFTGERGKTDIALLAPTTYYYLNGEVRSSITTATLLRDLYDYDVVDELLIADGILQDSRFRLILALDCPIVEMPILGRLFAWVKRGGTLVWAGTLPESVEGSERWPVNERRLSAQYGRGRIYQCSARHEEVASTLQKIFSGIQNEQPALDGVADNVWVTEFKSRVLLLNLGKDPMKKQFSWKGRFHDLLLPPDQIIEVHDK